MNFLEENLCHKYTPKRICTIAAFACNGDGIRAVGMNLA
jgi:hypothetical protein